MNWWALSSLFAFSIVKFMFTPFGGPKLGLTFFETYFSCVAGGISGAALFYFSSGYFMHRAHENRVKKKLEAELTGIPVKQKKKFTRTNKFIIRIKRSIGIIGICFWAPFFLSVPVGSIVASKFYGHHKRTFPLIVLGMFINAFITTGIAYLSYG